MASAEKQLCDAIYNGRFDEAETLVRDHPDLNVNWKNVSGWTALHYASWYGHSEVVKLFLAHPAINVNVLTKAGSTPLLLSCSSGKVSVVQVLLKDPRVEITLADEGNCTPLWWAAGCGQEVVVEWLIACDRDLGDVKNIKGKHLGGKKCTALKIAREKGESKVMSLLERFLAKPESTRHQVRVKLGLSDALAAEVFALTIFLCDDLLQFKAIFVTHRRSATVTSIRRFFKMMSKLPMDVQMIICHRVVRSMKQNILRKDSESAFKSLARRLLLSQDR
jgi:hypothetical protein